MRVIAGKAKGRRLKSPLTGTRPMTDRMKESVFSALGELEGQRVLDVYAGSGSLGLEAVSRGAAMAIFIERERDAIVKLEENIAVTDAGERSEVNWIDAKTYLSKFATERMDLIFLDPPYDMPVPHVQEDLENLVMNGYLEDEGRIVVHRPVKERRLHPLGLKLVWERDFGQSHIYVFTHEDEDEA
jgi:16S rRNA (guanine966-N2)-methyltransferase